MSSSVSDRVSAESRHRDLLIREGSSYALLDPLVLNLAINNFWAQFGFAFGWGRFDRNALEGYYLRSDLARELSEFYGENFEVRVARPLNDLIEGLIKRRPVTSHSGYATDLISTSRLVGWEFSVGCTLFMCILDGKPQDLTVSMLDPDANASPQGKEWIVFDLAGSLGSPGEILQLDADEIGKKALGEPDS